MDNKLIRTAENGISSLPDDVICHILSFLPTEESVRTRVLSTRWKHLFSLVPVLYFKFDPSTTSTFDSISSSCISNKNRLIGTFLEHLGKNSLIGTSTHTSSVPSARTKRFLDFVDWVFNSYNAYPMYKFLFKASGKYQEASRLLSWISESVRLGVRELDVSMVFKVPQALPRGLFNCETLTHLKICGNFVIYVPDAACLPCVNTLWLFGASFDDGHSAWRLFRSFPVLEDLVLSLSHPGDIQVIDVFVPTLKSLYVIQNENDNCVLLLNTPNLEYLDYSRYAPHGVYAGQTLKSLNKAVIDFPPHFRDLYDSLEKLISVVCHIPVLRVCTRTLEALRTSGRSLPIFPNLTRLEINVLSSFDSGFIPHLLFSMPNVEVLEVESGEFVDRNSHLFPEDVPPCVSLHLKEIIFTGFSMMEHELKLVEYFLKNAQVLDTLKIESDNSVENQFELSVELLTLPRYSRTCRIVLTQDEGER